MPWLPDRDVRSHLDVGEPVSRSVNRFVFSRQGNEVLGKSCQIRSSFIFMGNQRLNDRKPESPLHGRRNHTERRFCLSPSRPKVQQSSVWVSEVQTTSHGFRFVHQSSSFGWGIIQARRDKKIRRKVVPCSPNIPPPNCPRHPHLGTALRDHLCWQRCGRIVASRV